MFENQAALVGLQLGAAGEIPGQAPGPIVASLAVMAFLALLVAVKVSTIGMALWLDYVYPKASRFAYERYRTQSRRCFWIGLVNLVVGLLLVLFLLATKVLAFLGILLLIVIGLLAVLGLGAAFRHLGTRLLRKLPEDEPAPWPLLAGGLVVEAASCLPVLGQIFMLGVVIRGFGAAILAAMASRRRVSEIAVPVAPPIEQA